MDLVRLLPDVVLEVAAKALANPRPIATPQLAATVVPLRDGDGRPGGVEVFLLTRQSTMRDFPGASVFPGGRVEPCDFDPAIPWSVEPELGALRDLAPHEARATVVAAIRETFEESDILFADATGRPLRAGAPGPDLNLSDSIGSFARHLRDAGLGLRPDQLTYWGSWLTPTFQPQRFDARFFLASVPDGAAARVASGESSDGRWFAIRDVISLADQGLMYLMPPTYLMCMELFASRSVADARDRVAAPTTVLPELIVGPEGASLRLPRRFKELDEAIHADGAVGRPSCAQRAESQATNAIGTI